MIDIRLLADFLRLTEEETILSLIDADAIEEIGPVDPDVALRFACAHIAGSLNGCVCPPGWISSYMAASRRWNRFLRRRIAECQHFR